MNIHRKKQITPEKAQAWSLAMYPLVILALVIFMIVTNRPITTDVIGLFMGLIAAGSLKAVVQKKGDDRAKSDDSSDHSRNVHRTRSEELETNDWRRPDDPNRWRYSHISLHAG